MIRSRLPVVWMSLFAVAGCYVSQPVTGGVAPEVGSRVVLEINDAGRMGLGYKMGTEIDRVDGMLNQKDTAGMLVAVKHVVGLRGSVQVWNDEQVRIEDDFVRSISLRQFSRGRSVVAGVAGVGGITFLMTSGFTAFLFGDNDKNIPTDTLGQTILRVVRP